MKWLLVMSILTGHSIHGHLCSIFFHLHVVFQMTYLVKYELHIWFEIVCTPPLCWFYFCNVWWFYKVKKKLAPLHSHVSVTIFTYQAFVPLILSYLSSMDPHPHHVLKHISRLSRHHLFLFSLLLFEPPRFIILFMLATPVLHPSLATFPFPSFVLPSPFLSSVSPLVTVSSILLVCFSTPCVTKRWLTPIFFLSNAIWVLIRHRNKEAAADRLPHTLHCRSKRSSNNAGFVQD